MPSVKRGSPPIGYYTATTTKRKLGNISDGRLRHYVQQGKIERFIPPGMSQGFYNRKDVDQLVRVIDEFYDDPTQPGPQFQTIVAEDMPEVVDFMVEQFGGGNTLEKRLEWLRYNPEIAFIERNTSKGRKKGKIVGCAFIIPLTPEKIKQLFASSVSSTQLITGADVQSYTPGKPVDLFVMGMAVQANTGRMIKSARGQTMLRGVMRFLVDLGQKGVDIRLIAARSETRDGIRLVKHIGFTEIESPTENRNFIIDVELSGIPLIMQYKKAFAQWKEAHSQQQR